MACELGGYLSPGDAVSGWFVQAVKRVRAADREAADTAQCRRWTIAGHAARDASRPAAHATSLAIIAGANVRAVQRMLGHASASMTLDVYAELFEDDLNEVAEALDLERAGALKEQ
ncbi:hypothetical protein AB0N59_02110 [Microbacterium sp. NPDC089321]|uniref:hypothetical protein n=1 Tax=Microbacterium sp. NPDC089321 TaxID=3155183 RepID=UPI00341208CB